MDQHPVPQNISSYEFRLVGDMTLKQFFQLAGGIVLALIWFRTPFPFFIKYPLIFISVLGGILMAFVPLQGRPFSQWITAFFKAAYSPTEFFWKPGPVAAAPVLATSTTLVKAPTTSSSPLDRLETQLVSKFTDLFDTVSHLPSFHRSEVSSPGVSIPQAAPVPYPAQSPAPEPVAPLPTPVAAAPFVPTVEVNPFSAVGLTPTATHTPLAGTAANLSTANIFMPTYPNILTGVVVDGQSRVVEGAILEIAEKATGLPVRALRSNKLGQFQIATPLPSDEYVITTEKEGLIFNPLVITTSGNIIPPIEVRASGVN